MSIHIKSVLTALWLCFFLLSTDGYSLIAPVKKTPENSYLLISSNDIKMSFETIGLHHHPLGIWLVNYETSLQNLRVEPITLVVGFPSGYDQRMIEGDVVCDFFENFKVEINGYRLSNIQYLKTCSNYVEATGIEWTMDDGSGQGFLNVWPMSFKPDEEKRIKISFSFIVTKPPVIYNPKNQASWYVDSMNWLRHDYALREQNQFKLPLSLGSFWALYPDYVVIRAFTSDDWLKVVDQSEREYQPENITSYYYSEPYGFYSPPPVDLKPLDLETLKQMSETELMLLKNSFAAKYGKTFSQPPLKLFFSHQPWYSPRRFFHLWYLTDWDAENIKMIHQFEKGME